MRSFFLLLIGTVSVWGMLTLVDLIEKRASSNPQPNNPHPREPVVPQVRGVSLMATIGLITKVHQEYLATVDYIHMCHIKNLESDGDALNIYFSAAPCDTLVDTTDANRKVMFEWGFNVHHDESGRSHLELDMSRGSSM